jgi:hypothetical protein
VSFGSTSRPKASIEAHVQELLDLAAVDLRVGRHQHPAGKILGAHELSHLLEVLG